MAADFHPEVTHELQVAWCSRRCTVTYALVLWV